MNSYVLILVLNEVLKVTFSTKCVMGHSDKEHVNRKSSATYLLQRREGASLVKQQHIESE